MSQGLDAVKSSLVKLSDQIDRTLAQQSTPPAATESDLVQVAGVIDSLTAKLAAGPVAPPPVDAPPAT